MFANAIKFSSNFFKHADRGDDAEKTSIEFDPLVNDMFISMSTQGLKQLGYSSNGHEAAFCLWEMIHHPQVLNDETLELIEATVSTDVIESLKRIPRSEFLHRVLQTFGQASA